MAEMREVVVRGSVTGFAQEILAGRHRLTVDEPLAAGFRYRTHREVPKPDSLAN